MDYRTKQLRLVTVIVRENVRFLTLFKVCRLKDQLRGLSAKFERNLDQCGPVDLYYGIATIPNEPF